MTRRKSKIRVLVNVAYSYAIIGEAARDIQAKECWKDNPKIKSLIFTQKWVSAFIKRGGLSRRKITRDDKDIPRDEEIKTVLGIGQQLYIENNHDARTTYNFDETAFTWAIGPTHIFCPKNQQKKQILEYQTQK